MGRYLLLLPHYLRPYYDGDYNSLYLGPKEGHCTALTVNNIEFNQHQRNAFCVFSGVGVTGLRRYLNHEARNRQENGEFEEDVATLTAEANDDDDLVMTGMMGATALGGGEIEAGASANASTNTLQPPPPPPPPPQPNYTI